MSVELAELRRKMDGLMDIATRTSQDVSWIKQGIEQGVVRDKEHEDRIGKLEKRQHFYAGFSACVGAILTALGMHVKSSWGGPVL